MTGVKGGFFDHILSDGVGKAAGLEAPGVSAEELWIDGLDFVGGLVGRFVVVTLPISKWKCGLHQWLLSNLGLSPVYLVDVVLGLALTR